MRKTKKNIISLLVCTMFFIIFNCRSVSASENNIDDGVIIETEDGYEYVYTPDKECWDELGTNVEMINALQIPTETLDQLSTEEIIKLITEYPLLGNIYCFDTLYDGYNKLKNNYNAINYVLQRDDCFEELLNFYRNYEIPDERIIDYSSLTALSETTYINAINTFAGDRKNTKLIMEDALVLPSIEVTELMLYEFIDDEDKYYEFMQVYNEVLSHKYQSEYYDDVDVNKVLNLMTGASPLISVSVIIQTPGGTNVTCTYNNTTVSDTSQDSYYRSTYHCKLISYGTIAYNCHSYAWLKNLYPTEYTKLWLNSVSAFISDPSYGKENSPTAPGRIASWSAHSAIVQEISKSNPYNHNIPEPYVISKWSTRGVYSHYLSFCPFYDDGSNPKYYYLK